MNRSKAEAYITEAGKLNPGKWVGHSYNVAIAAEKIASAANLDSDLAYTYGLLHDIGRRKGIYKIRHAIDGYNFMLAQGHKNHARICISHCYTLKDISIYQDYNDYTESELSTVETLLQKYKYNDYDKLIQLCDFLGLPDRLCKIEERIEDVLSRVKSPSKQFIQNLEKKYELLSYFKQKTQTDLNFLYSE